MSEVEWCRFDGGSWNYFCVCYSATLGPDIHTHGLFCAVLFTSMSVVTKALVRV